MNASRDPSVFDLRMTGRGGALGTHPTGCIKLFLYNTDNAFD